MTQPFQRKTARLRENLCVLSAAKRGNDAEHRERETQVTYAIGDEGFSRCVRRRKSRGAAAGWDGLRALDPGWARASA